jgi:hypothetical protein
MVRKNFWYDLAAVKAFSARGYDAQYRRGHSFVMTEPTGIVRVAIKKKVSEIGRHLPGYCLN